MPRIVMVLLLLPVHCAPAAVAVAHRDCATAIAISHCYALQMTIAITATAVCWEICNVQRINGDGQMNGWRVQNHEEENAETKGEGRRVELSLLVFNLGAQCFILSMDDSMSIQH